MRKYLVIFIAFLISSCAKSIKEENDTSTLKNLNTDTISVVEVDKEEPTSTQTPITFKERSEKAILLGDKIKLLDNKLNIIEDISNLSGKIIDLLGISDSLFNTEEDMCNGYWYAKIQVNDKIGIVNGRQVYQLQSSFKENNIEIFRTEFLGIGTAYDGELYGCSVFQPIVIKDRVNNYFGLVDLIENEFSKEAIHNQIFSFFQLRQDDGVSDQIQSLLEEEEGVTLDIHRYFMEGENDYKVSLKFENGNYRGEYLNFGDIYYEEELTSELREFNIDYIKSNTSELSIITNKSFDEENQGGYIPEEFILKYITPHKIEVGYPEYLYPEYLQAYSFREFKELSQYSLFTFTYDDESCCRNLYMVTFKSDTLEIIDIATLGYTGGDGGWVGNKYGKWINDSTLNLIAASEYDEESSDKIEIDTTWSQINISPEGIIHETRIDSVKYIGGKKIY